MATVNGGVSVAYPQVKHYPQTEADTMQPLQQHTEKMEPQKTPATLNYVHQDEIW